MARTKAVTPKAPKTALATVTAGSKGLSTLDQELAEQAIALKQQIHQPGGNQIKIQANGTFTAPDGFDLGSEIQVVVLDFVSVNKFYLTPFNRDNPVPPDCYAVGRVIKDMVPLPEAPNVQNDKCWTCPMGGQNAYGSGQGGRGKACQNRFVVAVLLVDANDPEGIADPSAQIYTLDLAPTNMKYFDGFVTNVSRSLGHPIKAIVSVVAKNVGTYAQVSFVDPVPNPYYAQHAERRAECQDMLFRTPDFTAKAVSRAPARPPAPRRAGAAAARR